MSRPVAQFPRPVAPSTARTPLPAIEFPEALPVSACRDTIAAAIRAHPVVIVCGETGSGKTTQLPKICAQLGRGEHGWIGHTQPRRLAATSVARRIAEELGSPLGVHVGFKIRFNEKFAAGARIKLMTDGVLLAETLSDPLLARYDTIIVDEAHERSLNIDFLLGYLKQLLAGPRAHDLKLIITSATIDAGRFAEHFGSAGVPAPVIEVSGRLYPVEIRYRGGQDPLDDSPDGGEPVAPAPAAAPAPPTDTPRRRTSHRDDDDETDLPSMIEESIEELWREGPGDVLVFLPGEREIRDVADHLRRAHARELARRSGNPLGRGDMEILPLFSRLGAADQERVFSESNGRRVVLATNVAETSLTVPGIRYVVDSGVARVKRYRYRSKVDQLQVEPISQAAANQRAGRCGRVADGICIRLYEEADFNRRPRFTDPEVLRTSLAAAILRMAALRLSDIAQFPFLDPPPRKAIADGYALLHELNAVDAENRLTAMGEQLARLPVDPKIGRMLLAGRATGCLREVLVIAAALSAQDPRERPMEMQQAADQQHRRFADEQSDFLALLKLWDYWQGAVAGRGPAGESVRKLTARLQREFLSPRKLREWADVHAQLLDTVQEMRWRINDQPAGYEAVHQALLSGLLGNLGTKAPEDASYSGTHGTRFVIHPSSWLTRKAPRWLMAAEMVDTGRLYARVVAKIDPAWIERLGAHLLDRSWTDPTWSKNAGQVMASERGMLYGLTIYSGRRVNYGPREPKLARELLIREALVKGDWLDGPDARRLPFIAHNRQLITEIEKLEHKIRRPDLLVDPQFLFDWFDARVPQDITSGQALERWVRSASVEQPRLLFLARDELLRKESEGITSEAYPRKLAMRGVVYELDYHFDPGATDDGVTMTVPLPLLNQVDAQRAQWLVPGMLRDKVTALLKSLPQKLRRQVVPVPEYVEAFCARWAGREGERGLIEALMTDLQQERSVRTVADDYKLEQVNAHLQMNFRVVDAHGRFIGASRNLAQLRADHGRQAQSAFQQAMQQVAPGLQPAAAAPAPVPAAAPAPMPVASRQGVATARAHPAGERFQEWRFGELPELMELEQMVSGVRQTLVGYPALLDRQDSVELVVFDEPQEADREHRKGLARLFQLVLKEPLRFFERNLPDAQRLALLYLPHGTVEVLRAELQFALVNRACLLEPLPRDATAFQRRVDEARPRLNLIGQELARGLLQILTEQATVTKRLAAARGFPAVVEDIEQQLQGLLGKGFVVRTDAAHWSHLPRYLKAIVLRLEKLRADPARDAARMAELAPLLTGYRRLLAARKGQVDPRLEEFRWLLEELRVSMFAQELRTPMPVSVKRLHKVWDTLRSV